MKYAILTLYYFLNLKTLMNYLLLLKEFIQLFYNQYTFLYYQL